jgi:hypothetical protein
MKESDRKRRPIRRVEETERLRQVWGDAIGDDRPGVEPNEVFARLLLRYGAKSAEAERAAGEILRG